MEHILAFSVRRRWLVLLMTLAAAISGAWALTKLPIDAVPDVTNVQVQINAFAPALSPIEIEKQVQPAERATAFNGTIRMFNFVMSKMNHFAKTANHEICRPLRGLGHPCALDPGAYAPGFMPSRAPRALLVLTW